MDKPFLIVAIDGGAASGKSSTARALSELFNFLHSDTGAYYRALTAELLRQKVSAIDFTAIKQALAKMELATHVEGRAAIMKINGEITGDEIRTTEVNAAVSHFAAIPEVRQALLEYQRSQAEVARSHDFRGLVMEGRDIGSIIFPKADFRFFLFADQQERARRRAREGQVDQIAERDRLDTQRKTAPLTCPKGAISIDTTQLILEEVVGQMAKSIAEKLV